MTKYDERFKLEVVQRYLSGDKGCKALAREFGVSSTQVEQWVASYKRHGADGLRRKGHVKYSAQFKLEALERMQRENLSRTHMQALLDIRDAGAIARWERQYHEGGFAALLPRPKGRRPKMSTSPLSEPAPPESEPDTRTREQLLKEVEYLRAEVAYLKKLNALIRAEQRQTRRAKRK